MDKKILIIDTDPGIDDSIALLLLSKYRDRFDIRLFCATAGNTSIENTSNNLQYFATNYFDGVSVAIGSKTPLVPQEKSSAENVHGATGLGNFKIPRFGKQLENSDLAMFNTIKNADTLVTIVTLGALTNVARLIINHPEIVGKIECIYSMIGSVAGKGNITKYAEFNAYFDPEAFGIVSKCGIPIVFNTMELGIACKIKKQYFYENTNSPTQVAIKEMIEGSYEPIDPTCFAVFDALSIIALIDPGQFEFVNCSVEVITSGKKAGQSLFKADKNGLHCYQKLKDANYTSNYLLTELKSIN